MKSSYLTIKNATIVTMDSTFGVIYNIDLLIETQTGAWIRWYWYGWDAIELRNQDSLGFVRCWLWYCYVCLNNFARPSSTRYNISHSSLFSESWFPRSKSYQAPPLVIRIIPVTSFAVPVCSGRKLITEYARWTNDVNKIDWFFDKEFASEESRRASSAKSEMNIRDVRCSQKFYCQGELYLP